MTIELLVELGWKSLLLSALILTALWMATKRSAAEKALIGDAGFLSLLLLPATVLWLPRFELAAPQAVGSAIHKFASPSEAGPAGPLASTAAGAEQVSAFDWNAIALTFYLVPAVALIGGLLYGLVRLRRLYHRAKVLEDGRWLTALASAQNRIGVKHGTALLLSDEVDSPISWGVIRPVIMVDPVALEASDQAEAIIAHELAHVHRFDWLRLVVARLVTAFLWFNPLVWVVARRCHQLREEAADDAVLRTDVARSDYADLLITAVRHANDRPLLAANGVAPSKSSIGKRVAHVLDVSMPRRPAALEWSAAVVAFALTANAALAASEPVLERGWGIDPNAGERAAAELAALPSTHTQTLARAIRSREWSLRRVAGNTRFNEPWAIRPLMQALRDDDPTVRRIAVWGLSQLRPTPDPLATPAVDRLLDDPVAEVRAEAATTLGEFKTVKNSRSIEKLLLLDPSPLVRVRAAIALGKIRDPDSRETLELALGDISAPVRKEVKQALRRVSETEEAKNP